MFWFVGFYEAPKFHDLICWTVAVTIIEEPNVVHFDIFGDRVYKISETNIKERAGMWTSLTGALLNWYSRPIYYCITS